MVTSEIQTLAERQSIKDSNLFDIFEDYRSSKHFSHLRTEGIKLVEGKGPHTARLMVVGDAPGARENGLGEPFVGRAGQVLTGLLAMAGFAREEVYLTYVVKYRTPGNRQPTAKEVLRSQKFLRREWMEVQPLVTVALGETAQAALDVEGLSHGILNPWWYNDESSIQHKIAAVAHPSQALRKKGLRVWCENEWKLLGEEIREFVPQALCPDCKGRGPRLGEKCFCTGTLTF